MSNSFLLLLILPQNYPDSEIPLDYIQDDAEQRMIPGEFLDGMLNLKCP